jgi:hypothetical protein
MLLDKNVAGLKKRNSAVALKRIFRLIDAHLAEKNKNYVY